MHVPTTAQATQLKALQATAATANATLITAQATLVTAQAAALAANKAVVDYQAYIYSGSRSLSTGIIDDGSSGNSV